MQAYRKLEELQKLLPSQNIRYYISQASLEALQREMGVPMHHQNNRLGGKEEDEVEEDLSVSWNSFPLFQQYLYVYFLHICLDEEKLSEF